jgi:hypothetical protein
MYYDGIQQGRTLKEINEEFSKLCRKNAMDALMRERQDLSTPHKCSAVPIVTLASENESSSKEYRIL